MNKLLSALILFAGLTSGCGSGKGSCTIGDDTTCSDGKVCEDLVVGGKSSPACFLPSAFRGDVKNAAMGGIISNARVVLWNTKTLKAVGPAVKVDSNGHFEIRDILPRVDGKGVNQVYNLRISAPGYLDYPGGVRTAETLALSIENAGAEGQRRTLRAQELQAIPGAAAGSIAGKVSGDPAGAAVLVVAEGGGKAFSGVADANGDYVIYNVPDGTYEVRGYLRDASWGPGSATVAGGAATADLASAATPGSVTGKVDLGGKSACSTGPVGVVVAVKSTGEFVPGVRGDVKDGSYEVKGVPAGTLTILASHENDCMVRDPASTEAPGITHAFTPGEAFSAVDHVVPLVTAVRIDHPGGGNYEEVFGVDTFRWQPVEGADTYKIEVYDVFGTLLPMGTKTVLASMLDPMFGGTLSPEKEMIPLAGGLHYQWRVTAEKGGKVLSKSEELKGQFFRAR